MKLYNTFLFLALSTIAFSCSNSKNATEQADSTNIEIAEVTATPLTLSVVSATPTGSESMISKTISLSKDPIEVDTTDLSVINIPVDFSNIRAYAYNENDTSTLYSKTEHCSFGVISEGIEGEVEVPFGLFIDLLDASGNVIGEAVYDNEKAFMDYGRKDTTTVALPFKVKLNPGNKKLLAGVSFRHVELYVYAYDDID